VAQQVLDPAELVRLQKVATRVFVHHALVDYVVRLVVATRTPAEHGLSDIAGWVSYGASPRAAIAIAEAGRAHALISGRPTVGFEDVKAVAEPVLNHRLLLNYQARFDRMSPSQLVRELLGQLDETGLKLPDDVEMQTA